MDCGRFFFAYDMNGDGATTISDIGLLAESIWLLPAKALFSVLDSAPQSARFFEITCKTGEGWGGAIFSFFVWGMVFSFWIQLVETLDERERAAQKRKKAAKGYDE